MVNMINNSCITQTLCPNTHVSQADDQIAVFSAPSFKRFVISVYLYKIFPPKRYIASAEITRKMRMWLIHFRKQRTVNGSRTLFTFFEKKLNFVCLSLKIPGKASFVMVALVPYKYNPVCAFFL